MKEKKFLEKLIHRLLQAVRFAGLSVIKTARLQLVFSVAWLPIAAFWGLPWPLLAPLGNIIFGPVATLFLFVASLLFFGQLCGVTCGLVSYLLEKITRYWIISVTWLPVWSNYAHVQPSKMTCLLLLLCIACIVHCRLLRTAKRQTLSLLLLFVFSWLLLAAKESKLDVIRADIACQGGAITAVYENGNLALIDLGALGRRVSVETWIEYKLVPLIYKKWGVNKISTLIATRCNLTTVRALATLCTVMPVEHLYLVYWQESDEKDMRVRRAYGKLATVLKQAGGHVHRYGYTACDVFLTPRSKVHIQPTGLIKKNGSLSYPDTELVYQGNFSETSMITP